MHEVNEKVSDMRNRAGGADFMSLKVTSLILSVILPDFVSLINVCLEEEEFPDRLKKVRVMPLHKGPNQSDFKGYRPKVKKVKFLFDKIYGAQ